MAKSKGQFLDEWGRGKARERYADGGSVEAQEARDAAAKQMKNTRSMPDSFLVGGEPKEKEPTFGAGSSFLSKDAPSGVRKLVGGK